MFVKYGKIREVSIARKKDASKEGGAVLLSMGYGFVSYHKAVSAMEAIKQAQNSALDGHHVELKISNRVTLKNTTARKLQEEKRKQPSTKIIVRNIPFEAKLQELQQLFSVFGELKSVRVPKKLRGTHRGFGFVDFMTKDDAKRAFSALCHSTHLYGRRLVLEWADTEETVEMIRRKTSLTYTQSDQSDEPSKKKGKTSLMEHLNMKSWWHALNLLDEHDDNSDNEPDDDDDDQSINQSIFHITYMMLMDSDDDDKYQVAIVSPRRDKETTLISISRDILHKRIIEYRVWFLLLISL